MGKKSKKKGKLFNSCSTNSGYMQWVGDGETSSESSANYIISNNHVMNGKAKERSIMFESRCIVTDKQDIEFSVIVTIRKGTATVDGDKKGKGHERVVVLNAPT